MKTKKVSKVRREMNTLDAMSKYFCEATKEVLEASTGTEVYYSPTIQIIPEIHLRPEIGCFVQFSGDYSGLLIMNFSGGSALKIYRRQMMSMGLPEDELASEHTSDEVVDSIGEVINQIIGKARKKIETQYGLSAFNSQPKAIALTSSIILNINSVTSTQRFDNCRRLSFKIDNQSFHIEISMEQAEFVSMDGQNPHIMKPETGDSTIDEFEKMKMEGQAANIKAAKLPPPDDFEDEFERIKASGGL